MKNLLQRISEGETLVADGAMGTMLMTLDFELKKCPEIVNLAHPEILEGIALQYLEAGADIIQTNTFGASPLKLALNQLDEKTEEINKNAVKAVKKAVGGRAFVSASGGPTGRLLKPFGDTDPEEIYQAFEQQFRFIAEIGVNVFCIETMTDITEATLAVEAAKAVAPQIPVMATMTFDETPRGYFTIMGVSVKQAAEELQKAGADIVGSNCGNGILKMIKVAREFKNCTDLPLLIQANAGLPELVDGKLVYRETPEFMAEKARELREIGVSIIGGCCGTTPEHIKALRKMVDSR
ncbi:MAG: homocysteine S-methyltransferase family protein [candidate division Zixibacteria bacterium]|nr:homocysteine S-methyltransferase family protein [candidate division Zixibacteria bacterium]